MDEMGRGFVFQNVREACDVARLQRIIKLKKNRIK